MQEECDQVHIMVLWVLNSMVSRLWQYLTHWWPGNIFLFISQILIDRALHLGQHLQKGVTYNSLALSCILGSLMSTRWEFKSVVIFWTFLKSMHWLESNANHCTFCSNNHERIAHISHLYRGKILRSPRKSNQVHLWCQFDRICECQAWAGEIQAYYNHTSFDLSPAESLNAVCQMLWLW